MEMLPELSIKDSEIRYRRLFEAAQDGILILDASTGGITDVNPYLIKMLGYSRDEFIEKKLWEVGAFRDIEASRNAFEALQLNEYIRYEDLPLKTKDGQLIQVEFVSNVYIVGAEKVIQCNIRDITIRKRTENALRESEERFHTILNSAPITIFATDNNGIFTLNEGRGLRRVGMQTGENVGMSAFDLFGSMSIDEPGGKVSTGGDIIRRVLSGETVNGISEIEDVCFDNKFVPLHDSLGGVSGLVGIATDITDLKRAESALRNSEARFRMLVDHLPTVVYTNSLGDATSTLFVSSQIQTLMGYSPEEWLLDPKLWSKTLHPDDSERVLARAEETDRNSEPFDMEYRMVTRSGHQVWVHDQVIHVNDQEGQPRYRQGIMLDITTRKQAELELQTAAKFLQSVQDSLSTHIAILDYAGNIVQVNKAWRDFGARNGLNSANDGIGMNYLDICASVTDQGAGLALMVANAIRAVRAGGSDEIRIEYPCHAPLEQSWFYAHITGFENNQQKWIVVAHENITNLKIAEQRVQSQLDHLTALRSIDRVVAANFDLELSLVEILTHLTAQLGVDAADILILNSGMQVLEFGARRGFRRSLFKNEQIRLRDNYAGRVVLERKLINVPNLAVEANKINLSTTLLQGEDFVCYYGLPLIAKGQVKGVLEIFHRSVLQPDAEWFSFFHALAGQTAIAIEHAFAFENIQRSNLELTMAYDATIEGWSHALDLRDKETEGHSQRVTDMTVKLARTFGLSEPELMQVRWGALLHDIGKMGVPDGILLESSPLTDEEWILMKKHPTFAYEMLSPIYYLRHALDIPYYHHEKWDGSGYPQSIKGSLIPLSARIFAVVDIWDALMSDRTYRPAWAKEKVIEYIRALSGNHLDPQVVDGFLKLLKE